MLPRVVGVPGAVMMGLGSILGTGIFVSVGIAAGVAGSWVILAVGLAACVAVCNGLSSAQLAASHPVSGGTYEYGYRYLNPTLGFVAGWAFLCAKSASAATAALGLAGYLLAALGVSGGRTVVACVAIAVVTAIVAGGMQRSSRANVVIVAATLAALGVFIAVCAPAALEGGAGHLVPSGGVDLEALLHATALMFVAYTGYGRIATLGEEIREPRKIPRAIIITLLVTMALYLVVVSVAVAAVGAPALAQATRSVAAPLEVVARQTGGPLAAGVVAVGAITAMFGVLLNLILGLSRVLLAMARRGDMPRPLAVVDGASPRWAVMATGGLVILLASLGSVRTTWSFSAVTVLLYYAITNLAALRLPAADRRYPAWISVVGLFSCLSLAFWVDAQVWIVAIAVIGVGLVWHQVARRRSARR